MNFLIKIHIGLFVYGLFIKAARIFGVYSEQTFGYYYLCILLLPNNICVVYPIMSTMTIKFDWQISFPNDSIHDRKTFRFKITWMFGRRKEIIAFSSCFFLRFCGWDLMLAVLPASLERFVINKNFMNIYRGCLVKGRRRISLVLGTWLKWKNFVLWDEDFIALIKWFWNSLRVPHSFSWKDNFSFLCLPLLGNDFISISWISLLSFCCWPWTCCGVEGTKYIQKKVNLTLKKSLVLKCQKKNRVCKSRNEKTSP